jgi:predicted phage-related endonuclease
MTSTSGDDAIDIHPVCDACFTEERPGLFNSSDNGCLFGVGRKTLAQVTAEKRDPSLDPYNGKGDNQMLERGNDFQEPATKRVEKLRPTWRITRNKNHYVDRLNRIAAIPDNLVEAPERKGVGCLEIKVVTNTVFKKQWLNDTPPLMHLLQLTGQMMLVPNCTWGAIGALVVGEFKYETHVYEIERNRQAEIRLRTAIAEFWKKFDAGDHPAVDFERDGALIEMLNAVETPGKVIDLTRDNEIGDLLERREILRITADDVGKRLKTVEAEIKNKIGDAEIALCNDWRVSFKTISKKAYSVAASSYRQLRATRQEKEADSAH